jgi:hypothetical protein
VFASGHQHDTTGLMIVPATASAAVHDGAHRAAEEIAGGGHAAAAGQRGDGRFIGGHRRIVPGDGRTLVGLMEPDRSDPTVLWRMTRGRNTAHATVFPGPDRATVTWFIDGQMDRAENYDSMELALARADHIRSILAEDGWKDA